MSTPFKMKGFVGFGNSPLKENGEKKQTKRALVEKTSSAYGNSGGYESKEFVKGGRKGDKTTKSTEYTKRNAGTDPDSKTTYTKTKTKINKKGETKVKTKEISAKRYERQTRRKKARAIRRGDDTESYNS